MASGGSWSSMGCSVRMSSPRGYAGLSGVRITGIYPFHRRSLDHAIGRERRPRRPIMATSGGKRGALRLIALLAIVGVAVYLLMLGALHFLRPDVNPVTEP